MFRKSLSKSQENNKQTIFPVSDKFWAILLKTAKESSDPQITIEYILNIIDLNETRIRDNFKKLNFDNNKFDLETLHEKSNLIIEFTDCVYNLRVIEPFKNLYTFLFDLRKLTNDVDRVLWFGKKYLEIKNIKKECLKEIEKNEFDLEIIDDRQTYLYRFNRRYESSKKQKTSLEEKELPTNVDVNGIKAISEIETENINNRKEIVLLKQQLEELKEENKKLKSLLEESSTQNDEMKNENENLKRKTIKFDELTKENDELKGEIKELMKNQPKEPIDIFIDISQALKGSYIQMQTGETFEIPRGIEENVTFIINENVYRIKYKEDNIYKRVGNDLIGKFSYPIQYQNEKTYINYPIEGIKEIIELKEGSVSFEGLGFYDNETGTTGNYIIYISLE